MNRYTQDPTLMTSAVIWRAPFSDLKMHETDDFERLFQATTEQPTFVGLLGCEFHLHLFSQEVKLTSLLA